MAKGGTIIGRDFSLELWITVFDEVWCGSMIIIQWLFIWLFPSLIKCINYSDRLNYSQTALTVHNLVKLNEYQLPVLTVHNWWVEWMPATRQYWLCLLWSADWMPATRQYDCAKIGQLIECQLTESTDCAWTGELTECLLS